MVVSDYMRISTNYSMFSIVLRKVKMTAIKKNKLFHNNLFFL